MGSPHRRHGLERRERLAEMPTGKLSRATHFHSLDLSNKTNTTARIRTPTTRADSHCLFLLASRSRSLCPSREKCSSNSLQKHGRGAFSSYGSICPLALISDLVVTWCLASKPASCPSVLRNRVSLLTKSEHSSALGYLLSQQYPFFPFRQFSQRYSDTLFVPSHSC